MLYLYAFIMFFSLVIGGNVFMYTLLDIYSIEKGTSIILVSVIIGGYSAIKMDKLS